GRQGVKCEKGVAVGAGQGFEPSASAEGGCDALPTTDRQRGRLARLPLVLQSRQQFVDALPGRVALGGAAGRLAVDLLDAVLLAAQRPHEALAQLLLRAALGQRLEVLADAALLLMDAVAFLLQTGQRLVELAPLTSGLDHLAQHSLRPRIDLLLLQP